MILGGLCDVELSTVVNHGLCTVNRKLILVTAVVNLENKAAVSCDCAGEDAVSGDREALTSLGIDGDVRAGSGRNDLDISCAVSAVDIHDVSLNLVGDFAGGELSVEGNILGAHDSDFLIPTGEDIAGLGRSFGSDDLLADLRGNDSVLSAVNIEGCVVGHDLKRSNCIVDSLGGCIDNRLLGILLAGNFFCKSCIESRSGLCGVGLVVTVLCLLRLSRCNCRIVSGVVSVVLAPLGNEGQVGCGHVGGNINVPADEGVALTRCRGGNVKSCAVVNFGLCAVNSKLVLVTGKVDLQYEAAVGCDGTADNISCRLVEGKAFGGSCVCSDPGAGGAVKGLCLSCAVVAVDIHRVNLDGVGNAGRLFELGGEGDILNAHLADFLIPSLEDIAFLSGILRSDDLLANLRGNDFVLDAVDREDRVVGHNFESCNCVVDSLGSCIDNRLLGILLTGNIYGKSACESISGLGGVHLVIILFALLCLSRCDCRVVSGVVSVVLAPLGNEGQVRCGHVGGNFDIPAGEGEALSCCRSGNVKSCAIVNIRLYAVNRKLVLVTAVVDLKNKAAVGSNNAGEDAVVSNGEALTSLRLDGDGCAGGCGNSLGLCCAVLSVKTHDISLNLVGNLARGELSVEGNILSAHNADCGIPTGEDIAGLGRSFGSNDLRADLRGNDSVLSAVNIEGCVVGHKIESCDCVVDSRGGCINKTLLGVLLAGDIVSKSFCKSSSGLGGVLLAVVLFALLLLSRCDCRIVSGVVSVVLCPLCSDCYVVCGHGLGKRRIPTCEGVVRLDGVCYGNSRAIVEGIRNAFSGKGVLVAAVEYLEDKASVCRDLAGKNALVRNGEALASLRCVGSGRAGGTGKLLRSGIAVSAVGAHYIGVDGVSGVTCCCEHCLEGSVCGTHNADGGSPTCEGVAFLGRILGSDDLIVNLRGNFGVFFAVDCEYCVVGHLVETCDCIVDSGCCRINFTLLGVLLVGDVHCESCRESISARLGVSCCVVGLGLLSLSSLDCRVISSVISIVLCPLGLKSYIVSGHGRGSRGFPAGEGVTGSCLGICDLESCAIVNHGLCAVNSKLVLVTAVVNLENKAAVSCDCAGENALACNREALAGIGGKSYLCAGGCCNVLGIGCAVLTVKTHDIGLNSVRNFACGELSIEGEILSAHGSDLGIPTGEDITCLGGIIGLGNSFADLCFDDFVLSAVNIEGGFVGHELKSCDRIVDCLSGYINFTLLGVLPAGNILRKGIGESLSGLCGVGLVEVCFFLLSLSRCLSRVVSGVVSVVLVPLGNKSYIGSGHGFGNISVPTGEGVALTSCRLGNTDGCAVINIGHIAVNSKLVLIAAVVNLENKAAVSLDFAGKYALSCNREALTSLGSNGDGLAGSSGLVLDSSVAIVAGDIHYVCLDSVSNGACGEYCVEGNILNAHRSDFGSPSGEGVTLLGGSLGGDDLLADLGGNDSVLFAVNIEGCVVGHLLKTVNSSVDSCGLSVDNTLLAELLVGDVNCKSGVKSFSGSLGVGLVVVVLCLLCVGSCNSYVVIGVVCGLLVPLSRKSDVLCGHGGGNLFLPTLESKTFLLGSTGGDSSAIIICIGVKIRVSISYGVLFT